MPLVGFTKKEVTATESGPQLPEPVIEIVEVREATESTDNRPSIAVTILYPVPEDSEVGDKKARRVYGLGKGIDLPLTDSDGNRLQFSSQLFAAKQKEEDKKDGDSEDNDPADES